MNVAFWIRSTFARHPFVLLGTVIIFALAFTEGVKKIRYAESLLQEITNAGIEKPGGVGSLQLKLWYANFLFILVIAVFFLVALSIRDRIVLFHGRKPELVKKTLDGMMAASARISNQLIPKNHELNLDFRLQDITYVIRKNGDADVTRRYHIQSSDAAIHFWETRITVDDHALPVDYLCSMNFKITDESGKAVAYLPSRNGARSKAVVIYFLPRIEPMETTPRMIRLTYKWPGLANQLKSGVRDNWSWSIKSRSPVPEVRIKFLYEDLGGVVRATIVGSEQGEQNLEYREADAADLRGLEYTIKNAPASKYGLELRLESHPTKPVSSLSP